MSEGKGWSGNIFYFPIRLPSPIKLKKDLRKEGYRLSRISTLATFGPSYLSHSVTSGWSTLKVI
jgi:hypothetical protein